MQFCSFHYDMNQKDFNNLGKAYIEYYRIKYFTDLQYIFVNLICLVYDRHIIYKNGYGPVDHFKYLSLFGPV